MAKYRKKPVTWQRFALGEQWGSTEPHYVDGEQLGKNVVTVTVAPDHVTRFERALDRDESVLSYREVV